MRRVWGFVTACSLLMIAGAVAALLRANIGPSSRGALTGWTIWQGGPIGHARHAPGGTMDGRAPMVEGPVRGVLVASLVAGKEVWGAVALREGSLRGRRAPVPLASAMRAPSASAARSALTSP